MTLLLTGKKSGISTKNRKLFSGKGINYGGF